jgi:RHS repeat-associated protein
VTAKRWPIAASIGELTIDGGDRRRHRVPGPRGKRSGVAPRSPRALDHPHEHALLDPPAHDHAPYAAHRPVHVPAYALKLYEESYPFGTSAYRAVDSGIAASAKRYRYTGKERDEETGLDHMGARYYAAWLGRWTSADPIGLGDGVNRFAYVSGNPVGLRDPSGTTGEPSDDYRSLPTSEQHAFDKALESDLKRLHPERDRAEVWQRARAKIDSADSTLGALLPAELPARSAAEVKVGRKDGEDAYVGVRATTESRTDGKLRQRGDYDRATGELRRKRPGKEIRVTIADPLAGMMVNIDREKLYAATRGDHRGLREALLDQLATNLAATASHELFHAQRRLRDEGVEPSSGLTFDSPRQATLDRVLENRDVGAVASRSDALLPGHGKFLAEEAFVSITSREGVGLDPPSADQFQRGYTPDIDNPTKRRTVQANVKPAFEAVQDLLTTSSEFLQDPRLLERLAQLATAI